MRALSVLFLLVSAGPVAADETKGGSDVDFADDVRVEHVKGPNGEDCLLTKAGLVCPPEPAPVVPSEPLAPGTGGDQGGPKIAVVEPDAGTGGDQGDDSSLACDEILLPLPRRRDGDRANRAERDRLCRLAKSAKAAGMTTAQVDQVIPGAVPVPKETIACFSGSYPGTLPSQNLAFQLCKDTKKASKTLSCFKRKTHDGLTPEAAIHDCSKP